MRDARFHPRTGKLLRPVGVVAGRPVWPILGAEDAGAGGGDGGNGDGGKPAEEPKPKPPAGDKPADKPAGKSLDEITDPDVLRDLARQRAHEAANWRSQYRETEGDAAKWREAQEAERPELERVTSRAERAEATLKDTQTTVARLEVALEKGLTMSQARRLVGSTKEEIEADADEVLRDFGTRADQESKPRPPQGKPREDLRPGAAPSGSGNGQEPAPGRQRIAAAYAENAKDS